MTSFLATWSNPVSVEGRVSASMPLPLKVGEIREDLAAGGINLVDGGRKRALRAIAGINIAVFGQQGDVSRRRFQYAKPATLMSPFAVTDKSPAPSAYMPRGVVVLVKPKSSTVPTLTAAAEFTSIAPPL